MDGAAWLDQLPQELDAQRHLLSRFLFWCSQDPDVRWLTIGCSLERGNADRLSDLDAAIGVKEEHFQEALGRVRQVLDPKPEEVRLWACQGWEALVNVGKYLRRSSFWEALSQVEEARTYVFRLWALAENVPQARYGITALIDAGASMPPGIDKSLPGTDLTELLGAARYLAKALTELQHRLGRNGPYQLPDAFAEFVATDLASIPGQNLQGA